MFDAVCPQINFIAVHCLYLPNYNITNITSVHPHPGINIGIIYIWPASTLHYSHIYNNSEV